MLADKVAGTQELASTFAFNPNKAAEYDPKAALAPPKGASATPADPIVGASTVSELNDQGKLAAAGRRSATTRRSVRWIACASTPPTAR